TLMTAKVTGKVKLMAASSSGPSMPTKKVLTTWNSLYLKTVPWSYGLLGVSITIPTLLNALSRANRSAILTVVRLFVCVLPLSYLGSELYGFQGLLVGLVAGNACIGLLSWGVARLTLRDVARATRPSLAPHSIEVAKRLQLAYPRGSRFTNKEGFMGAWGELAFDNDTANDWAYGLDDVSDLSLVESAFDELEAIGDEYLDQDVACCALAACEVLARLRGNFGYKNAYTETVDDWVAAHPLTPSKALLSRAASAIDRILADASE